MMLEDDLQKSVVLITSRKPGNSQFGTGFVIHQIAEIAYVATCAHVVKQVGGSENVQVDDNIYSVEIYALDDEFDLAVLKVDGLPDKPLLSRCPASQKGIHFTLTGFHRAGASGQMHSSLSGHLGKPVKLRFGKGNPIRGWYLSIVDEQPLLPGYSGSPVVDDNGQVLGIAIASYGSDKKTGFAISIEELEKIWQIPDSNKLQNALLELDYRPQERSFLPIITKNSQLVVAFAFLIHGERDHGQIWLLHRLVNKLKGYLKESFPKRALYRQIPIPLDRVARSNSLIGVWYEVGRYFGLQENDPDPVKIAKRVAQACQRENIIFFVYKIDCMPKPFLDELIKDFWSLLIAQVNASLSQISLFMFLIDDEGRIEWDNFLTDLTKMDSTWTPDRPIKSPRLSKFSKEILTDWIIDQYGKLHLKQTKEKSIDEIAQQIMDKSEGGIPERVLDQICCRCGHDWYIESRDWLNYLKL